MTAALVPGSSATPTTSAPGGYNYSSPSSYATNFQSWQPAYDHNGGFANNGSQNWNQAVTTDVGHDAMKGSTWAGMGVTGGFYAPYRAFEGDRAWSKNKNAVSTANYNNHIAQQQYDIGNAWDTYSNGITSQFANQDQARAGAVQSIQQAYGSPAIAQANQQQYQAQLGSGLASNTANYQGESQNAGLNAIQSGMGGSSVDAEQQAQLGAAYAAQNYNTQSQAYGNLLSTEQAQQGQQQNLMLAALSGNQQSQQGYASMAQQNTNQAQILAQQAGFANANAQMANGYHANQSQAYGNAATQLGNAYSTYGVGQQYAQNQANQQAQNQNASAYYGY